MSKVLVIPDIHLKPWILDKAEGAAIAMGCDAYVFIGDLVDDWDQQNNLNLYSETFDKFIDFIKNHPNFYFCYGNHDISYEWKAMETGYSEAARPVILNGLDTIKKVLPRKRIAFVHKIDNVLFSHAGVVMEYVRYLFPHLTDDPDGLMEKINNTTKRNLWNDISPIWARPQYDKLKSYNNFLQVVGHTPVEKTMERDRFISVDSFSTHRNGTVIGDQKFVWIDTVTEEWGLYKS